jgi:hypothetical protein
MNFDPGNDQFVFVRRQFTGQKRAIKNGVNRYLALVVSMDVRHMMALNIAKEHANKKPVEHRNRWHSASLIEPDPITP